MVFLSLTFSIFLSIKLMDHHETHVVSKEKIGNIPIKSMKMIDPERLEHESMFTHTLKDCIPSTEAISNEKNKKKECKTFVPEGSKERIAVMAPPGKMDSNLLKLIQIVLRDGKRGQNGEVAAAQVEVIPISNIVSKLRCSPVDHIFCRSAL